MKMKNDQYILYIGNYLDEVVIKKRGLPSRNAAGSNRIHRIANALKSAGQKIIIVSPGVSLLTSLMQTFIHKTTVKRTGTVPVLFTPVIGLPFLGALSSFIFLPLYLIQLRKKRKR